MNLKWFGGKCNQQTDSYLDSIGELVGEVRHPEDDEVQVVVVVRPAPRGRPVGLLRHDPLHQAVRAVRERRAVLPHRVVHEAEVLEEQQLAVGVEAVEALPPGVLVQRVRDVHDVVLGVAHLADELSDAVKVR